MLIFQSTLPREERRPFVLSIHGFGIFQSTLPREERLSQLYVENDLYEFQSTLPREERLHGREAARLHTDFNPRSHERSDGGNYAYCITPSKFQSTLPREERQQYCTKNLFIFIQYRQ